MRSQSRAGFTLIELMVAMALTMLVMVILSQAFVVALDTFVGLKAIGDMQSNLRTAKVILFDDLSQDHFEGNWKLSDVTYNGQPRILSQKPLAGFFAVRQGSVAVPASATDAKPLSGYVQEGADDFTMPSLRATDHVLYMTVKRKGNRPENFYTAVPTGGLASNFFSLSMSYGMTQVELAPATFTFVGSGVFSSQWAEVIYYLKRTGSTEEPHNPNSVLGIPTFSLFRAQFAMVADGSNLTTAGFAPANLSGFQGISCGTTGPAGNLQFYSPADAALGVRMFNLATFTIADTRLFKSGLRETLVLQNVTSFQIQLMPLGDNAFRDVGGGIYDTVATLPSSMNTGLRGIQITLRVFEAKTRQTQQVTIVQDL